MEICIGVGIVSYIIIEPNSIGFSLCLGQCNHTIKGIYLVERMHLHLQRHARGSGTFYQLIIKIDLLQTADILGVTELTLSVNFYHNFFVQWLRVWFE